MSAPATDSHLGEARSPRGPARRDFCLSVWSQSHHTPVTSRHGPRSRRSQSFRAAWSIVLAVIGALGGGSSPLPLANAYQGASGALLLLAIFTIMSLPYDQPEVRGQSLY